MDQKEMKSGQSAFLLAQIGAYATAQFAERLAALQLTPPDAGILRIVRMAAGISQQDLSARLQVHPSRLVALLDKLESGHFIERKQNPEDRRLYSLHLTEAGVELLEKVSELACQHQQAMTAGIEQGGERGVNRTFAANGYRAGAHSGGSSGLSAVQGRQINR